MHRLADIKAAVLLNVEISKTYIHSGRVLPRGRLRGNPQTTAHLGHERTSDAGANYGLYWQRRERPS
jgi:hypothetical protein